MWTQFMDMHSGGGTKEPPYEYIYIEAPEAEARIIFFNRFGHNPERVSCTCCGDDYSIREEPTLEAITAFNRNCEWDKKAGGYVEKQKQSSLDIRARCNTKANDPWGLYQTVRQYTKRADVLVIRASAIKAAERKGSIPQQGYVWVS